MATVRSKQSILSLLVPLVGLEWQSKYFLMASFLAPNIPVPHSVDLQEAEVAAPNLGHAAAVDGDLTFIMILGFPLDFTTLDES